MSDWNQFFLIAAVGVGTFVSELTGAWQIPYSKFRRGGTFSARTGMFLLYVLPLLAYVAAYVVWGAPASVYHWALLGAWCFHFGKRCLESLLLHRYSRPMAFSAVLTIAASYSSAGVYAAYLASRVPAADGGNPERMPWLLAGGAVFVFGQALNFYHHLLLARLRADGSTDYRVPQGGLFGFVACPHYLAEIIAWLGFAIMLEQVPMFGFVIWVTCYLTARSLNTVKWYKANLPVYPANRKALFPGLL